MRRLSSVLTCTLTLLLAQAARACQHCHHWSQQSNLAEIVLQTKLLLGLMAAGSGALALANALRRRRQA